jgi:hypothetical protein
MDDLFSRLLHYYKKGLRQSHDATCGPISVILATLGLGFKKEKESKWRNPDLPHGMPVNEFLIRGMALYELQLISEMIYKQKIDIQLRRAYPENFELFLKDIEDFFLFKNSVLILNYRQDDFVSHNIACEHGNPHYSPVINWNSSQGKILIADVDPMIKEPYWVKIEDIFHSMAQINVVSELPRGWLKLRKRN